MNTMEFRAGRLITDPSTNRLSPDQRKGIIVISQLDELLYSFNYSLLDSEELSLDLVITQGDASFHHIAQQTNVIALKLASSGSKYFFWLQDPTDDGASIVKTVNGLLETASWPKRLKSDGYEGDDEPKSVDVKGSGANAASPKAGMIDEFVRSLTGMFGNNKKISLSTLLTIDNIMDLCKEDDLKELHGLFPEGYEANKTDLRRLVTSPYFQQSLSILQSIMASGTAGPAFLAQFGLLENANDGDLGIAGLLKALLKKHQP